MSRLVPRPSLQRGIRASRVIRDLSIVAEDALEGSCEGLGKGRGGGVQASINQEIKSFAVASGWY